MRLLLTIVHYELQMHLKSMRFKATCALAALANVILYIQMARVQEFDTTFFFEMQHFPAYLVVIAFTGLFSIGRIRAAGMHAILMTKPFPTFSLILGQMLAGLASLLFLFILLLYPGGLILKWQYGILFPARAYCHMILFLLAPLSCSILALTLWVRTCFKNNISAITILALLMGAMIWLANSSLVNDSVTDPPLHHFVPLLSYFSMNYIGRFLKNLGHPALSFTRLAYWRNGALSVVHSFIFLLLACYHLRRTEPQRKVLGRYGRRWYHIPTFIRFACDLKIDPQVTWRHHLALVLMLGIIMTGSVWPLARMHVKNYLAGRAIPPATQNGLSLEERYNPDHVPTESLVQARVIREERRQWPDRVLSRQTFVIDGDTSGRVALMRLQLLDYDNFLRVEVDGRPLPFQKTNRLIFQGADLAPYADGKPHQLTIEAASQTPVEVAEMKDELGWDCSFVFTKVYSFITRRMHEDSNGWSFDFWAEAKWPLRLKLYRDPAERLIDINVEPVVSREGKFNRFDFDIPAEKNGPVGYIVFSPQNTHEIIEVRRPRVRLYFSVLRPLAPTLRELLPMLIPELDEFCDLRHISIETPFSYGWGVVTSLETVRKYQGLYRRQGMLYPAEIEKLTEEMKNFEIDLLARLWSLGIFPRGLQSASQTWDFGDFRRKNITRGLNHRLPPGQPFEPVDFIPSDARLKPEQARKGCDLPRADLSWNKITIPVFQMLYLVLGHEGWQTMLDRLHTHTQTEFITPEMLQQAAEEAGGKPMGWFFDYWLRTGRDFPCYQIVSAEAELTTSGPRERTAYKITATLKNIGSGRMPVPIELRTTGQPLNDKVWIDANQTVTWTTISPNLPVSLWIDPEGWIMTRPQWDEAHKTWIHSVTSGINLKPAKA